MKVLFLGYFFEEPNCQDTLQVVVHTFPRYKINTARDMSKFNKWYPKMDGENNGKHMENPIKMDDLGVPLFSETPILDQEISSSLTTSTSHAWMISDVAKW